ncbi:MAG TPA: methionine ABC transporter ATP-binding protein [Alphaproteobacteria bacterium]|nr:methionine ABC transporter ATP-binding protein [Alphaproteobacteria bacterium]
MSVLENVGKSFAPRGTGAHTGTVQALEDVSLTVERGEIFGVIGRSGAGKSTLIRLINLLERPTRGRVLVDGKDMTALDESGLRAARREIGMIFQHFNLLSSRTVARNVALPLELAGKSRREIAAEVEPLLELVGLADKRDRYPAELSGGQKQRVGIARALASRPKVLLSDEATSALDPETTASILSLLADINQRLGLTIVVITHEMDVIKRIAHRVAVLDHGRVVEKGDVYDVLTRPESELTRRLVAGVVEHGLPEGIVDQLSDKRAPGAATVLRIIFRDAAANTPVISRLSRDHGLDLNILHGRVDQIRGRPFGTLVVQAHGAPEQIQAAVSQLQSLSLGVEVLGYVGTAIAAAG